MKFEMYPDALSRNFLEEYSKESEAFNGQFSPSFMPQPKNVETSEIVQILGKSPFSSIENQSYTESGIDLKQDFLKYPNILMSPTENLHLSEGQDRERSNQNPGSFERGQNRQQESDHISEPMCDQNNSEDENNENYTPSTATNEKKQKKYKLRDPNKNAFEQISTMIYNELKKHELECVVDEIKVGKVKSKQTLERLFEDQRVKPILASLFYSRRYKRLIQLNRADGSDKKISNCKVFYSLVHILRRR